MDRATRRGAGELLAIVWDMDGTLIDSATVVPDAYIRAITRLGGPTLTREAVIAAYGLGPPGPRRDGRVHRRQPRRRPDPAGVSRADGSFHRGGRWRRGRAPEARARRRPAGLQVARRRAGQRRLRRRLRQRPGGRPQQRRARLRRRLGPPLRPGLAGRSGAPPAGGAAGAAGRLRDAGAWPPPDPGLSDHAGAGAARRPRPAGRRPHAAPRAWPRLPAAGRRPPAARPA